MEMLKIAEQYSNEVVYEYYDDEVFVGEFSMFLGDNYIHGLKIAHPYRRKGYGTRMLQALFAERPTESFILHVEIDNFAAYAMYKKLGFKVEHTGIAWGRMAHKMVRKVM